MHGYDINLVLCLSAYPVFQCEFTLLLLPVLSRKLKRTTPSLLPHPPLLAHTIYQALTFDTAIIEEGFQLQATSAARGDLDDKWKGVSEVILGNVEWFEYWLNGERKCELTKVSYLRYNHKLTSQISRRKPIPRNY